MGSQHPPFNGPPLFKVGDVLSGIYEVRGILGQGGMGQVYEAYDRLLHRHVAIKVSWPGTHAVHREAQALAAIRHPSILLVFAAGDHAGVEYAVMERIHGVDLTTHMLRRTSNGKLFPLDEGLEILAALADGLAVVHGAGIAHRDIKPDNVMIAPLGRVVIMDFGVSIPEFEIAHRGATSGSPAYMAPETIRGRIDGGDGFLVDVYAFGILAFELLCGVLPYDGAHPTDIYMKHLGAPIPRVRQRRADVPESVDALISQLMSKDPSDRPQGMAEVAFRLRAVQELIFGMQIPSSHPGPSSSMRMPVAATGSVPVGAHRPRR